MKVFRINNLIIRKQNIQFGSSMPDAYIYDRDKKYPLRNPDRDILEYVDFEPEKDATYLPSQRFKYSSSFRDEELFDAKHDIHPYYRYLQYSDNDVYLNENLYNKFSKELQKHNIYWPETTPAGEAEFYGEIHSNSKDYRSFIYRSFEKQYETFINDSSKRIEDISGDYKLSRQIFKDCEMLKGGHFIVDENLCKLAIYLLDNTDEKVWGETESEIINKLKIPIYKNVGGAISLKRYEKAISGVLRGLPNEYILRNVKRISLAEVFDIVSFIK